MKDLELNAFYSAAGMPTEELKQRFAAGSIPLDSDFSSLIDMAECGRRAVGRSPDQTENNPGAGLTLGADDDSAMKGKLMVLAKPGSGITVDSSGVGIDAERIFTQGMIIMFSGSEIPAGWALCNGANNTPNLVDKFILGGTLSDIGGSGGTALTGDKNNKVFTLPTSPVNAGVSVSIYGHQLTIDELPAHNHTDGALYYYHSAACFDYQISDNHSATGDVRPESKSGVSVYEYSTSSIGGNNEHSHMAETTTSDHSHNVDITAPYYILAFIIKL